MDEFTRKKKTEERIVLTIFIIVILVYIFHGYIFNLFYDFIPSIPFKEISNLIFYIGGIFLGIIIPIFVFSVTLLGNAAEISREETTRLEKENNIEFSNRIRNLQKKISKDNEPIDLKSIRNQITDLEFRKEFNEKKIKSINNKYDSLNFKNSVLISSIYFLSSLTLNSIILNINKDVFWQFSVTFLSLLLLCLGIYKIIKSLRVIQEVSIVADDRRLEKEQKLIVGALKILKDNKKPKFCINFIEKSPLVLKINELSEIKFKISLKNDGAIEAKKIQLWFFMPPEIEFIQNSNYKIMGPQESDFTFPNAKTVIMDIDFLRKDTIENKTVKVKPTTAGENFYLAYTIDCENYSEPASKNKKIDIIVK